MSEMMRQIQASKVFLEEAQTQNQGLRVKIQELELDHKESLNLIETQKSEATQAMNRSDQLSEALLKAQEEYKLLKRNFQKQIHADEVKTLEINQSATQILEMQRELAYLRKIHLEYDELLITEKRNSEIIEKLDLKNSQLLIDLEMRQELLDSVTKAKKLTDEKLIETGQELVSIRKELQDKCMELENQQEKVSKLKNQVEEQRIKINELIYQNSNTIDVESRYRNMATHFEILENQVEALRQETESWRQKFVNSDKELFLSTEKLKITESVKQERDKLL